MWWVLVLCFKSGPKKPDKLLEYFEKQREVWRSCVVLSKVRLGGVSVDFRKKYRNNCIHLVYKKRLVCIVGISRNWLVKSIEKFQN